MEYNKYCWIDLNNKTSNCGDKYNNVATTCKVVKDNIKTFYPTPSSENPIMAVTRDPQIDYNYFRASR